MSPINPDFDASVFINCPFDKDYLPMLRSMLFTLVYCGFQPRIGSERYNSLEGRLEKIKELIRDCRYSIHDISRMDAMKEGEFPRFNMPFELGIDLGCRVFGNGFCSQKECVVFEKEKYRYTKVISDLSGVDIMDHGMQPELLVHRLREWLRVTTKKKLPHWKKIWEYFVEFWSDFDRITREEHFTDDDIENMSSVEFIDYIHDWMSAKKTVI